MRSQDDDIWVQASGGDLMRADVIAELHCQDGEPAHDSRTGGNCIWQDPAAPMTLL
jgi:hypothetical protein